MFMGIFDTRKRRGKTLERGVFYQSTRNGVKYCFRSNVKLTTEQLSKAMDIIQCNASRDIDEAETAYEIFRKCFVGESGFATLTHAKEGKRWFIEIKKNYLFTK